MSKSDKIWQKIVEARGQAPRVMVVEYVKTVITEAKDSSFEQLAQLGSADSMSQGEVVASKLITCLGQQLWLEQDEELSYILEIAGELDRQADDRRLWSKLFEVIERL